MRLAAHWSRPAKPTPPAPGSSTSFVGCRGRSGSRRECCATTSSRAGPVTRTALADDQAALDELAAAIAADDRRTAPVDAGQGVGMVTGVAPVAQVIDRLCEGAEKLLTNWHRET